MKINNTPIDTLDHSEEKEFSYSGCENCNNGLGNGVYDCNAWFFDKKMFADKFKVKLCSECLYAFFYGSEVEKNEECEDIYDIY